ncbi:MAG TPA: hypothetical protein VNA65_03675 [Candidatus Dormibacteraeota bacterium]|nr:hypothetical protein [Candidatus Dormibacteraeota bacterium]
MQIVVAIGVLLCLIGFAWLLNIFGAGDYMIRRVTSQNLGSLPPGFASTLRGFRIYAVLVAAIGVVCLGLGLTERSVPLGAGLIVVGAVTFGIASMLAIAGEIETARTKR